MRTEAYPPILAGTRVRTTAPRTERSEWAAEVWEARKWNVQGIVLKHHDSHGLCYEIWHENDGTKAFYDPKEFDVLPLERFTTEDIEHLLKGEPFDGDTMA